MNKFKKFFYRILYDLLRPRNRVTNADPPKDYMYYNSIVTENVTGEFYELEPESSDDPDEDS